VIVEVIAPAPTVLDVLEPAANVLEVSYVRGLTGAQGEQGIQGVKGDTGATGATGATGPQGEQGIQGVKGDKGDTGDTGPQGSSGVVSVTAPITNTGTSTAANIGIDQAGLTLAQSQITGLVTALGAKAGLGTSNTFSVGEQVIATGAAGNRGLVIKPVTGQTGLNIDVRNTADTGTVFSVDATGNTRTGAVINTTTFNNSRIQLLSTGTVIDTQVATNRPLTVKGAASQSANLQEWQNSAGSILGKFDSAGQMWAASLYTNNFWARIGENNSGGQITLIRSTAAGTGTANGLRFQVVAGTNANTYKFVAIGPSNTVTTILDNIPQ
jgi:hypothetical protein